MNDLKQFLGSYNLCARFAPGFLFVVAVYFLLGYDINILQTNSVLFILLMLILSGVCGFISSALIKNVEQFLWNKCGNPTIIYLKLHKKDIYKELLENHNDDKNIMRFLLKITRNDDKLFWKNVAYGFFRNSILLSLVCLYFSYFSRHFCLNIWICVFFMFMTLICSIYYAEQAIKSYQENICKENKEINT